MTHPPVTPSHMLMAVCRIPTQSTMEDLSMDETEKRKEQGSFRERNAGVRILCLPASYGKVCHNVSLPSI
jgi:hypothetical protein